MNPILELYTRGKPETFGDKITEESWKEKISTRIREEWGNNGYIIEKIQINLTSSFTIKGIQI